MTYLNSASDTTSRPPTNAPVVDDLQDNPRPTTTARPTTTEQTTTTFKTTAVKKTTPKVHEQIKKYDCVD